MKQEREEVAQQTHDPGFTGRFNQQGPNLAWLTPAIIDGDVYDLILNIRHNRGGADCSGSSGRRRRSKETD